MKSHVRKTRPWLRFAIVVATVLCLPRPSGAAPEPRHGDTRVELFTELLRHDGFEVSPGTASRWDTVDLYCSGTIESAWYASNEPYLRVQVPRSAQEQQAGTPSVDFRLNPDEAIVLVGVTPPPAKYFSYTPYLGWRTYPDGRKYAFATLGDGVNNATVNTIGGKPFSAPVALIFTPDEGTDARVRSALRRAGYPTAIINTVVFPASMLRLGYDDAADELEIVLRNAIWQHDDEGEEYLENAPLQVFRVTPRPGSAVARPFDAPPLRIRGTGHSEMRLMNSLGQLRQHIIDKHQKQQPELEATDVVPRPMCVEGYDLIQRGAPMCGDNRDAFYVTAGFLSDVDSTDLTLDDGEFLIIYGVNHVASGKATYMNVNVYADEVARLTVAHIDDRKFHGTANPYFPDPADPVADVMYVYKVSRNCQGEPQCLELSTCGALTLDSKTLLGIFTRVYLEPATKVGPAMPEILYDRVLKFSPRKPAPRRSG